MSFPDLTLSKWHSSLIALQTYAKIVAQIRRQLTPKTKHWWHLGLQTSAVGLTTTPIPFKDVTFDLELDLISHELLIRTSVGDEDFISLDGQPARDFAEELLEILEDFGIEIAIDNDVADSDAELTYDDTAIEALWAALSQIDVILKEFKAGIRGETGQVYLWGHHFDLAMLWFSGRLVPGQDPDDEENADEQMNFGFSPGGDSVAENPYFYITAYPTPDGFKDIALPNGAFWPQEGFNGAVLLYETFAEADKPKELLLTFLQTVFNHGSSLMA